MSKVGRNAPCPCGSGKKYKKCCLSRQYEQRQEAAEEQRERESEDYPASRLSQPKSRPQISGNNSPVGMA